MIAAGAIDLEASFRRAATGQERTSANGRSGRPLSHESIPLYTLRSCTKIDERSLGNAKKPKANGCNGLISLV